MPRRERWSILGSILVAIDEQWSESGENARVTNVATRANIPYDRLMLYLEELGRAGLVTGERMPRVTPKGREFLRLYRQWTDVLDRFGLS